TDLELFAANTKQLLAYAGASQPHGVASDGRDSTAIGSKVRRYQLGVAVPDLDIVEPNPQLLGADLSHRRRGCAGAHLHRADQQVDRAIFVDLHAGRREISVDMWVCDSTANVHCGLPKPRNAPPNGLFVYTT